MVGFAATVVGTLGLAIGTITAVFAVLDHVLLSPLPYAHPERLVFIAATAPGSDMKGEFGPAGEFFLQYQDSSKLVEDVAIYGNFTKNEELLGNYGFSSTYNGAGGLNESTMEAPSDVIYLLEARAKGESPLTGQTAMGSDGSPYTEPSSTTWNEVFQMMSGRHTGGQVTVWGDTHAKFVKYDWLRGDKGKAAIVPGVASLNLANNVTWP